ncbi:hypothetical protein AB6A40_000980 [Gnathostoma spinigerum]|uniref:Uncharacterized protein n=1 Tax=Gnathostoma spinigerum TaxID=75299 RepID=A0ABD6E4F1_9BILA
MLFSIFATVIFVESNCVLSFNAISSANQQRSLKSNAAQSQFIKVYHYYDNITNCLEACEVQCELIQVVHNDVGEKWQYTCHQRRMLHSSPHRSTRGAFLIILLGAALILGCTGFAMCFLCICCWDMQYPSTRSCPNRSPIMPHVSSI